MAADTIAGIVAADTIAGIVAAGTIVGTVAADTIVGTATDKVMEHSFAHQLSPIMIATIVTLLLKFSF